MTLPAITSIAKTLGTRRVAEEALAWTRRHPVTSVLVSDAAALSACRRFIDDHRTLVEPACGAALAAIYERVPALGATTGPVLVIVCGGAVVQLSDLPS